MLTFVVLVLRIWANVGEWDRECRGNYHLLWFYNSKKHSPIIYQGETTFSRYFGCHMGRLSVGGVNLMTTSWDVRTRAANSNNVHLDYHLLHIYEQLNIEILHIKFWIFWIKSTWKSPPGALPCPGGVQPKMVGCNKIIPVSSYLASKISDSTHEISSQVATVQIGERRLLSGVQVPVETSLV